jgi:hypothetical protein
MSLAIVEAYPNRGVEIEWWHIIVCLRYLLSGLMRGGFIKGSVFCFIPLYSDISISYLVHVF